jgi:hypothetical protein
MNASGSLVSVHLTGEGNDEISLDTLPGKFSVTRTDEVLTPYGGLAAWSGFLKHLGIIERLADHCPVVRSSSNAAPVREVLHSLSVGIARGRQALLSCALGDDGIESRASHRSDQITAELFIPGGAGGRKRTATHRKTGCGNGPVAGVKELLRKAADVVGATAPQLESQGNFPRLLSRQTTDDLLQWLAQPAPNPAV